MNWDDLRIIAAVRDQGTYTRASARLRIDETTVARRVARLQDRLGVALFNAADGVRVPTPHCETILGHVDDMARHVAEIDKVGKVTPGVIGRVRLASTDSIAEQILAPGVAGLLGDNPGLALHFTVSDENVNFARWETDLAIRLRKPDRGNFAITKLGALRLYFFEPAAPALGAEPVVCCYADDLDQTPESQFLIGRRLQGRGRCITGSLRIIRTLLQTGTAVGILPEHMCGDLLTDPRLRATLLTARKDAWLLVQSHLRRDAAARVVIEWVRGCFAELAARQPPG